MVLLATTPEGLKEALALAQSHGFAVWCSAGTISEQEFTARKEPALTRFSHSLSGLEPEVIADAVATIREHHPNERVWVEASGEL
jgi:hypothetical protein